MRTSVAVLIPVLDRPQRVGPLVSALEDSARFVELTPVFLCSPDDADEHEAIVEAGCEPVIVPWDPGQGDYAMKMNYGWQITKDEFVFLAADDLVFRPGWIERALACHMETRACVVGTNDLGNSTVVRGDHSTHTLVHRDYGECGVIDDPARVLHEGYWHNWVDNEFVETAIARETFASALDCIVEHLHPIWKRPNSLAVDATYEKGQEHFQVDHELFRQRRALWSL